MTRLTAEDVEREPITDMETLAKQDERDMRSGYEAGLNGREEPGVEFNRSYWHGWKNGMVDSGRVKNPDAHQAKLAHEFIKAGNLS